jgi:hypothetical protein
MAKSSVRRPTQKIGTILLEVFKKSITPVLEEESETYANEIAARLRRKIENDEFVFKARYNKEYEKRKKRDPENLDSGGNTPLYYTGQYHDSIGVERRGNTWVVGVEEGKPHYPVHGGKPVSMLIIARTMEFGSTSKNIPPRPHWRPVLTEMRKEHNLTASKWSKRMKLEADKAYKEYLGSFETAEL